MEGEDPGATTGWLLLISVLCPGQTSAVLTGPEPAVCFQISAVSPASGASESCHQGKLEFLDVLLITYKP